MTKNKARVNIVQPKLCFGNSMEGRYKIMKCSDSVVYTYPELFEKYPNEWLSVRVHERDSSGYGIKTMHVISHSLSKDSIISEAKRLKKLGGDIAVITTIETLEDAVAFTFFDNNVVNREYVSPEEYALMFQLYYGLTVAEEYLE